MLEITMEELQKQLEEAKAQLEESNKQVANLKTTLSEKNSENAKKKREAEEWKEKYTSTLSAAEKAEAERKEAEAAKKAAEEATAKELKELKRDNTINKYKAKYLAMGYSEELAQSSAEARVDGNDEVLFQNESKFAEQMKEITKAELLKTQPGLSGGKPLSDEEKQKILDKKLYEYAGL